MSGIPLDDLESTALDGMTHLDALGADVLRRAAVTVADIIGARHPHPLDKRLPRLAGLCLAQSPPVRDELLDMLGYFGLATTSGGAR